MDYEKILKEKYEEIKRIKIQRNEYEQKLIKLYRINSELRQQVSDLVDALKNKK